jgi:rhomboid protease GluP
LEAAGYVYRLSHIENGWVIYVSAERADAALAEIEAYEKDNRNWPPVESPEPIASTTESSSWSPIWVVGFLTVFYFCLGPYDAERELLRTAAMDTEAVRGGDWWRLFTALTVHADAGHLIANVCTLLLLGHVACRQFGSGLAWALVLVSAVGGHLLETFFMPRGPASIGASTAGFGALGILAAHRTVKLARRLQLSRIAARRIGLPLAAGFCMLALLGTGPRSDLASHLFGMLSGVILGAVIGFMSDPRLPAWCHRVLELGCLAAIMTAWRVVLEAKL